jgi:hypothetical protein
MEFAKNEIVAIEETVNQAVELEVRELNELQLTLVGGGCGDVSFL